MKVASVARVIGLAVGDVMRLSSQNTATFDACLRVYSTIEGRRPLHYRKMNEYHAGKGHSCLRALTSYDRTRKRPEDPTRSLFHERR
jgi:hypothetical protein